MECYGACLVHERLKCDGMRIIKYVRCKRINRGTEETPVWEEVFRKCEMGWNEANEEIAKKEAYNGEYTIEDDGQDEPVVEPTADEILNTMLGVNRYA